MMKNKDVWSFAAALLLAVAVLLPTGQAHAQGDAWTVLPMEARGVEPGAADIFRDLLQNELSTRTGAAFRDGSGSCTDVPCARNAGKVAGASTVVFGSMNALGSKIIIAVTVVSASTGDVLDNQKMTINQIEDLDAVAARMAEAIVTGKTTEETAELGNITEQDSIPERRRRFDRGFGLRVGGLAPLSDGYAGGTGGVLIDGSYWYETSQFAIEPRIGVRFNASRDNELNNSFLEVPMDLGAYYILGRSDFAPFIGGGAGLRYMSESRTEILRSGNVIVTESESTQRDSVFGFGTFARVGMLLFRTYTVRVAVTADYNITFVDLNGVTNPQSFTMGIGMFF